MHVTHVTRCTSHAIGASLRIPLAGATSAKST
jgi:hypothetical protein